MDKMSKITVMVVALVTVAMAIACSIAKKQETLPTRGEICFQVEPKGALVVVDGVEVGAADEFTEAKGCLSLEKGRHDVTISKDGYQSYEREFFIGTSTTNLNIKLLEEK